MPFGGTESPLYLDDKFTYGGRPDRPSCQACKQSIQAGDPTTRVEFQGDLDGSKGLTGEYHAACGKRAAALARVINLNPWAGW